MYSDCYSRDSHYRDSEVTFKSLSNIRRCVAVGESALAVMFKARHSHEQLDLNTKNISLTVNLPIVWVGPQVK